MNLENRTKLLMLDFLILCSHEPAGFSIHREKDTVCLILSKCVCF